MTIQDFINKFKNPDPIEKAANAIWNQIRQQKPKPAIGDTILTYYIETNTSLHDTYKTEGIEKGMNRLRDRQWIEIAADGSKVILTETGFKNF